MRNLPIAEADVVNERKDEGAQELVAGRLEELKRLEASERGLAEAIGAHAQAAEGGGRILYLAERHRRLAALKAERIVALGGRPDPDPDDLWIIGPTRSLTTLIYAEQAALRTYHDHLLDFEGETMRLVRDRIIPAHEDTLALLTGEEDRVELAMEHP
jgi:hypothetical protein